LCLTGREQTFGGMGGLREEAIEAILNRYDCNDIDTYETIISIETQMFDYLAKEQAKSKAQRQAENERLRAVQARSQGQSKVGGNQQGQRQPTNTYSAVVPRPTMKLPKGGK